jgi:pimeloyl-ACP methyl ester carboxylesterase
MINVYFISGMGASCAVFDKLVLPDNYQKKYIEWLLPNKYQSLESYTERMATSIQDSEPFILIGYSFGGILVQEIAKIKVPIKIILLASIQDPIQMPRYFNWGRKLKVYKTLPSFIFNKKLTTWIFDRLIYFSKNKKRTIDYLPMYNAIYMKWAMKQILYWKPAKIGTPIFQIHGDEDTTFPIKYIKKFTSINLTVIENAGHLLVLDKPREVSTAIYEILCCCCIL